MRNYGNSVVIRQTYEDKLFSYEVYKPSDQPRDYQCGGDYYPTVRGSTWKKKDLIRGPKFKNPRTEKSGVFLWQ